MQEDAEEVANVVGAMLEEAFGAVAALQQKAVALADLGKRLLQIARFACENERREGCKPSLCVGERLRVRIVWNLDDRF